MRRILASPSPLDTPEFELVAAAARGGRAAGPHGPLDARRVAGLIDRNRLGAPVVQLIADALADRPVAATLAVRAQR